jgi:hypothetical protein
MLAAGARRVFSLHPVRIPTKRKRTRRRLHSSRLSKALRILWRGHAKQGRKKPGRRAVLEETRCPSDRQYLTLREAFPQGNSLAQSGVKSLICNKLHHNHPSRVRGAFGSTETLYFEPLRTLLLCFCALLRRLLLARTRKTRTAKSRCATKTFAFESMLNLYI